MRVGDEVSERSATSEKTTSCGAAVSPSQECSAGLATVIIRIICLEGGTADKHVDSSRRRCKLDETQNAAGPPSAKANEKRIASLVPSAPPAQPEDVELTKKPEPILEIMGIRWGSVEVTNMIRELNEKGTRVDKVQLFWLVQENPYDTFVPAGSKDEVKMCWCHISRGKCEEGGREERYPPGPPQELHPVIHESVTPGAPPDLFRAEIIKRMHELIPELLVTERGVLGVGKVI